MHVHAHACSYPIVSATHTHRISPCAGWVAGPIVLFMFAWVTYFCSALLIDAYRYPTIDGPTVNYKYIDAVERYMGVLPRPQSTNFGSLRPCPWGEGYPQVAFLLGSQVHDRVSRKSNLIRVAGMAANRRSACRAGRGWSIACGTVQCERLLLQPLPPAACRSHARRCCTLCWLLGGVQAREVTVCMRRHQHGRHCHRLHRDRRHRRHVRALSRACPAFHPCLCQALLEVESANSHVPGVVPVLPVQDTHEDGLMRLCRCCRKG